MTTAPTMTRKPLSSARRGETLPHSYSSLEGVSPTGARPTVSRFSVQEKTGANPIAKRTEGKAARIANPNARTGFEVGEAALAEAHAGSGSAESSPPNSRDCASTFGEMRVSPSKPTQGTNGLSGGAPQEMAASRGFFARKGTPEHQAVSNPRRGNSVPVRGHVGSCSIAGVASRLSDSITPASPPCRRGPCALGRFSPARRAFSSRACTRRRSNSDRRGHRWFPGSPPLEKTRLFFSPSTTFRTAIPSVVREVSSSMCVSSRSVFMQTVKHEEFSEWRINRPESES